MKANQVAGAPLSQSKRCARCGLLLGPREASVALMGGRFRLLCKDQEACRGRRQEKKR
jgi:hypothetical protein